MSKEMKSLTENLRQYAMGYESSSRYKHSVRVAQMAKKLAKKYGGDPKKAFFAGLAHDLCKEMGSSALINFAKTDGLKITDMEKDKPSLLHGRAAAVLLQNFFHVNDLDILESVRYHTFGNAGMGKLAKIIYAADKIEPGRKHVNKKYYKKLFAMKLDDMVSCIVKENIEYLNAKDKAVSELTVKFLESLTLK